MELPEEVRRELEELYGSPEIPEYAVTLAMLSEVQGGSETMWAKRLKPMLESGKWLRGRKTGDQSYWYWPAQDEPG